ncbi:flagellin lysine-N-methylase [Paenibacillus arenosi]|uniref:Flagellin lysine-N-methylase n=1 Tax=Paenibacillus arenosi TaxID=2774142 RepID=A0ABR9AWK1_9BACL|nr:flagellin lysine-N-methylase [Paenibacillus arenosi]MBD8498266.1 flagellin lysine-N-methylase [Paenibacillus arenosi]
MIENTLMPSYMKNFACIGGDCEDTCCAGWKVTIDKDTYKKYKKSKKPKLLNSICMESAEDRTKSSYGYLKMSDDHRCPMLTDNSWCSIQLELGEEALSTTCTTYPRILNYVSDRFELSAAISCPEVARLALFNEDGIEFDELEFEVSSNWSIANVIKTNEGSDNEHLFWPVRMFSIEIVQYRNIALCDRLIILGLFIDRVQKEIDAGNTVNIENIVADYRNKMRDAAYVSSLSNINVNIELQARVILEILQFRFKHGGMIGRYEQTYNEMIKGYGITEIEDSSAQLIQAYQDNFSRYYKPYMEKMEYVLENYLVNTIFYKSFPSMMNKMFQDYMSIMVNYVLVKTHLVGVAGHYEGLNDDIVLRTIQSMAKATNHNATFTVNVMNLLEKNNYNSLAHIATLIKDVNVNATVGMR